MRAVRAAVITVLAMALGTIAVPTNAAYAAESATPRLRVARAEIVAKGAALEVTYTIVCPDVSKGRHAMFTTVHQGSIDVTDYLEFTCSTKPVTVTNLVSTRGGSAFTKASATVETVVTNLLYAPWEDPGPPGFYRVSFSDRVLPKWNGFSGESTVDLSADLDIVDAQLTPAGDVKLTQRLSCAVEGEFGFQTSVVTQVTSGGVARGFNDASAGMECGAPQTFTTLVPSSSVRFERGEAVIESAFAVCEEGCTRASDTAVVKLRECAPSRATGRMKAHGKGKVRAVPASADVAEPPRRGARRRTA